MKRKRERENKRKKRMSVCDKILNVELHITDYLNLHTCEQIHLITCIVAFSFYNYWKKKNLRNVNE